MHYDVIIVGAGPAGLSCAAKLAQNGINTLVIERNSEIGPKVCAGGITWSGLIKIIPQNLIERTFPSQYITTRFQNLRVDDTNPIIATVNRKRLGQYMAEVAKTHNATILTSSSLRTIDRKSISLINLKTKKTEKYSYDFLVGADGSSSMVRRYLGIPSEKAGIGINYEIEGYCKNMEWHLNDRFFKNGYGWIFPHSKTISIGAYIDKSGMSPSQLKKRLVVWANENEFDLSLEKCSAGLINYDYRGWQFGNVFLVGDAAGFASALTGEGIYPAIISGESAAQRILEPLCSLERIKRLEKKQKRFSSMVKLTSKNAFLSSVFAEIGVLALRTKMIDFTVLEMGT